MYHNISKAAMEFVNENYQSTREDEYTLLSTGCRFVDEITHTHPNFAGIELNIPQWDKIQLLSRINNLISKWIPLFANLGDIEFTQSSDEDKIIKLSKSDHCTLFKFFNTPSTSDSYQEAVKSLFYLYEVTEQPSGGGIFQMCRNPENDIITGGKVILNYGYLLYVPGVVLGLTVDIPKEFVSFPKADTVIDADGTFELDNEEMIDLLENIRNGLIMEENHCPHVTLGTSKEYKPVITGQILDVIHQFADLTKGKSGDEYKVYSADEKGAVSQVVPNYLNEVVRIIKSGPALNPDRLPQVIFGVANKIYEKGLEGRNYDFVPTPNIHLDFTNTTCIVANDLSLIYFKNLPMTNEFIVDAYLMPVGGDINSGKIKIFP